MSLRNIRYIHRQNCIFPKNRHDAITVAYCRRGTRILFAWTVKNKADAYNKEIGRFHATRTLEAHEYAFSGEQDQVSAGNNPLELWGIIDVRSRTFVTDALSAILSDQTMVELNSVDFKHSFIQHRLIEIISAAYNNFGQCYIPDSSNFMHSPVEFED